MGDGTPDSLCCAHLSRIHQIHRMIVCVRLCVYICERRATLSARSGNLIQSDAVGCAVIMQSRHAG